MYYYAELDENDVCTGVFESLEPIEDYMYIEIDSLNDNLIGLWYDRSTGEFETASFSVTAAHSTDEINYRSTDQRLSDLL